MNNLNKIMYLLDSNILRHFGEGHENLRLHLQRREGAEIALPSVVVAEMLRGRSEFALKASPSEAPRTHRFLQEALDILSKFNMLLFDEKSAQKLEYLRRKHKARKNYADMMISTMALAGKHIVVTLEHKGF
ncbi:PIN domain-containing protein [Desulfobacterales bacterium HSG2]|nr:PIN domain-containing protein [Desulfobacterales bacterium HSG2]